MNLTNVIGEYVDKSVSQLGGDLLRLKGPPDHTPMGIVEMLIAVFQTSSVDDFNQLFKTLRFTTKLEKKTYKVEDILRLAETTYKELLVTDEWTGTTTDPSALTAGGFQGECYNCG